MKNRKQGILRCRFRNRVEKTSMCIITRMD